jgi:AAA15 family ATPase/GTPase
MINKVSISNFKSIYKQDIELGRVNVFIGENGSGKSNILEAIAMAAASNRNELNTEALFNSGVRVAKPNLMFNSFLDEVNRNEIKIALNDSGALLESCLRCNNPDDIYAIWKDEKNGSQGLNIGFNVNELLEQLALTHSLSVDTLIKETSTKGSDAGSNESLISYLKTRRLNSQFLIYNISTNALRGITNESKKQPLGINGEGLDILLSTFTKEQLDELKESNFISWLKDIHVDIGDKLKVNGFKLGRSTSELYFTDKYMQKSNNMFSAENANEGALHVLFYLALFISERTPSFFAIDNIETALNPMLCRQLMTRITELAKKHQKQVLITTHNPAVLDGLNLHDPEQHLFVVKRTDEGHTKVERIKLKPDVNNGSLKLSELWMRGYLGALPSNVF